MDDLNDLSTAKEVARRGVPGLKNQLGQGDTQEAQYRQQLGELEYEDGSASYIVDGPREKRASAGYRLWKEVGGVIGWRTLAANGRAHELHENYEHR